MAFYYDRHGKLASTYGMVGANWEQEDKEAAESARQRGAQSAASYDAMKANASQELRARTAAEAQRAVAGTQADATVRAANAAADAVRDAARIRAGGGYAKGGPVIKGEFKHANPTYTKFGNTGDSSLLAKGRK